MKIREKLVMRALGLYILLAPDRGTAYFIGVIADAQKQVAAETTAAAS